MPENLKPQPCRQEPAAPPDQGTLGSPLNFEFGVDPQAAILAMVATGMTPWDAMVELVAAGVDPEVIPALAGVPRETLKRHRCVDDILFLCEKIAERGDSEGANLAFNRFLQGRFVDEWLDFRSEGWFTSLPEGLRVTDGLNLKGTLLTALPKGLVTRDLNLVRSGIQNLPADLQVGGDLDLRETLIAALPEGFSVGGDLHAEGLGFTHLPEGLAVGGSLFLMGCRQFLHLPERLCVAHTLDLRGCASWDGHLPSGIQVGQVWTEAGSLPWPPVR
jgi:hypothetical protein